MIRRPPRSTRTDNLFPYTTRFRSTISEEGIVTALFDNGQRQDIYQLPLGMFRNPNGLEGKTGNVYLETDRSGNFQFNLAGNGGAGDIRSEEHTFELQSLMRISYSVF